MPTRIILTYRDYEALPADGRRYELHDGELFVTAAPGLQHQRLVGNIFALLRERVRAQGLGEVFVSPVDCIFSDTTVIQPDVVFLESERRCLSPRRAPGGRRSRFTAAVLRPDDRRVRPLVLALIR
jgi:Uma2 family endonuclease